MPMNATLTADLIAARRHLVRWYSAWLTETESDPAQLDEPAPLVDAVVQLLAATVQAGVGIGPSLQRP